MKNLLKGNKVSLVACGLLLSSSFAFGANTIDSAFKEGKVPQWFGATDEKTVWELQHNAKNNLHPTQKPVELPFRAIKNSSKEGDIVLDLFGGSGSTLIACEQLDRICYMMELDPIYCDVIIKRWENFTGQKAELLDK